MTPPQFPADEALERRIALIDQSTSTGSAESQGVTEVQRLAVVEDVALAVVAGGRAWWLVTEHGATLDGQCLVSVDEGLADGQLTGSGSLQVNGHKSTGHWGIAGQEEGLSLLNQSSEAVADRVDSQVWSVVSYSDDDGGWFVFTCGQMRDTETVTSCNNN